MFSIFRIGCIRLYWANFNFLNFVVIWNFVLELWGKFVGVNKYRKFKMSADFFFSTENWLQNNFLECCFIVTFEHWYISMLEIKFLAFENLENLACQKFSCWIVHDVSCWIIGRSYGGFYGHYYEIDGLMQNLNEDLNGLVLG